MNNNSVYGHHGFEAWTVYWEEESIHGSNTLEDTVLPIPGTSVTEISVLPAMSFSNKKLIVLFHNDFHPSGELPKQRILARKL